MSHDNDFTESSIDSQNPSDLTHQTAQRMSSPIATYQMQDGFGTHTIEVERGTQLANKLLKTLWRTTRDYRVLDVFAYVHGHTDIVPMDSWLYVFEQTDDLVLVDVGRTGISILPPSDPTPDVQGWLSRMEQPIVATTAVDFDRIQGW